MHGLAHQRAVHVYRVIAAREIHTVSLGSHCTLPLAQFNYYFFCGIPFNGIGILIFRQRPVCVWLLELKKENNKINLVPCSVLGT